MTVFLVGIAALNLGFVLGRVFERFDYARHNEKKWRKRMEKRSS